MQRRDRSSLVDDFVFSGLRLLSREPSAVEDFPFSRSAYMNILFKYSELRGYENLLFNLL